MSYTTEKSTKKYSLTQIEQNILVDSLLGDGSLELYDRSKNGSTHIFPRIAIYTLCFSQEENEIIYFDVIYKIRRMRKAGLKI
jgi:hypothetical protein